MAKAEHGDEFVEHLLDLMRDLGGISARRMFGGHGIYRGNVMFGLVAANVLYLKADALNRPLFEAESLEPFTYEGKGKPIQMSYYRAPEQALESPGIMLEWAAHAYEAALRSGTRAKKKKSTAKTAPRKKAKKKAGKKTAGKSALTKKAKTSAEKKKKKKKTARKAAKKASKKAARKKATKKG